MLNFHIPACLVIMGEQVPAKSAQSGGLGPTSGAQDASEVARSQDEPWLCILEDLVFLLLIEHCACPCGFVAQASPHFLEF